VYVRDACTVIHVLFPVSCTYIVGMYHFDEPSSPDPNFSGSLSGSESLHIATPPHQPAHIPMQHAFPQYHSSPIPNYSRPGPSHATNQMLHSLMESQKKVLNVVENVSKRLDDLEQLVQAVASTDKEVESSKPESKIRVPPQLTVRTMQLYCSLNYVYNHNVILFSRKVLRVFTVPTMMNSSSKHIWGMTVPLCLLVANSFHVHVHAFLC